MTPFGAGRDHTPGDALRTRGGKALRPTETRARMLARWQAESEEADAWKAGLNITGKAERSPMEPEPPAEQGRLPL